jgi:hypothetical protein
MLQAMQSFERTVFSAANADACSPSDDWDAAGIARTRVVFDFGKSIRLGRVEETLTIALQ